MKKPYFAVVGSNSDSKNIFEKAFKGGDFDVQFFDDSTELVEEIIEHKLEVPEGVFLSSDSDDRNTIKLSEWFSRITLERGGVMPALFLMCSGDHVPEVYSEGVVDDCLLLPIRAMDLLSKARYTFLLKEWRQAQNVIHQLSEMEQGLQSHYKLASGLQRKLMPSKFKVGGGVRVSAKYLVGLRSGGDYYDVFQFDNTKDTGIFMADCSGYKLSSALMTVLLKLEIQKIKSMEETSPVKIIQEIYKQIRPNMRQIDHVSLFFGILNRKNYVLNYVSMGNIFSNCVRRSRRGSKALELEKIELLKNDQVLNSETNIDSIKAHRIKIKPLDRLVISSDGLSDFLSPDTNNIIEQINGLNSSESEQDLVNEKLKALKNSRKESRELFRKICENHVSNTSRDLLNELFFTLKDMNGKISVKSESMPGEDSSLLILDVSDRILRLA